ncbi:MAG: dTDP-glucose 4,6-dehydratase [Chitinophagaceae bacterium]|nr:dTDP-glucose 4,6-dehydratase [Chitinophagaceae bacterium]
MNFRKIILITGGAGFIGSHVVRHFVKKYPDYLIINVDALTYAGNLENLKDIENEPHYKFIKADVRDEEKINQIFEIFEIDGIIHLAAESHVDRSISDPLIFINTNIIGTVTLLNIAKKHWTHSSKKKLFYHISTDEVFGSLGNEGFFTEETPYNPQSPYSASKAASDHFVTSYYNTYKIPVVISHCSNNYGPHHFPEKLIPLCIHNIKNMKPIPIYGNGKNIRDWLFVEDHAKAIDIIFHFGKIGSSYNIGGNNEWTNIDVVRLLCSIMNKKLGRAEGISESLITFVKDRAGHDLRYAIDSSKIQQELGWEPQVPFEEGIEKTVNWYLQNDEWLKNVTSGEYQKYYNEYYQK